MYECCIYVWKILLRTAYRYVKNIVFYTLKGSTKYTAGVDSMCKQIVKSQKIEEGHRPSFAFNRVPTRVGWGTVANDELVGIINPVYIDAGARGAVSKKNKKPIVGGTRPGGQSSRHMGDGPWPTVHYSFGSRPINGGGKTCIYTHR